MSKNQTQDELTRERLLELLGTDADGLNIWVYPEIDSTNTEAKRMAVQSPDIRALVVAEAQSAGRGRMGRSFYSPEGRGIYFSLLFPVVGEMQSAVSLTCATSVAVMRALRDVTGRQTGIKWVNDLYYEKKKVCGILCEAVTVGDQKSVVIGIGINLSGDVFPKEIAQIAGSLSLDRPLRAELIAAILRELNPYIKDSANHSWLEDYRRYSTVLGQRVSWIRGEETHYGIARSIDEEGALLVAGEDCEGEIRLATGEISVRPLSD